MSRRLYEFLCPCGNKFTEYTEYETKELPCPCGNARARRIISSPRIALDGTDPSFPGAYDKWARKHEQAVKVANQKYRDHGDDTY